MDNSRFKFRAWDDKLKVMFTHEKEKELGDEREPLWKIPAAVGGILNYSDGILMQYIGLKDKNGKEIYEGDILTAQYAGSSQGPYKNKVIWDEGESGFSFANAPMWTWGNIEVIGNIYENPDLL